MGFVRERLDGLAIGMRCRRAVQGTVMLHSTYSAEGGKGKCGKTKKGETNEPTPHPTARKTASR